MSHQINHLHDFVGKTVKQIGYRESDLVINFGDNLEMVIKVEPSGFTFCQDGVKTHAPSVYAYVRQPVTQWVEKRLPVEGV